jgi:peptidoglycan/LPS O-acetylase OafA/YrhL
VGYDRVVARIVAFLASFIAVVAGVGQAVGWMTDHVSPLVIAIGFFVVFWTPIAGFLLVLLGRNSEIIAEAVPYLKALAVLWIAAVLCLVLSSRGSSVGAYAVGVASAAPIIWLAYMVDKYSHRECPDCAERVKSQARVCRYCGYRFKTNVPEAKSGVRP